MKSWIILCLSLLALVHRTEASPCYDGYCRNGGTCWDFQGMVSCSCPSNFTGPTCETNVDECLVLTDPCKNEATCTDYYGGYVCRCIYGWEGDDCSINKDDCVTSDGSVPCLSGGTCVDRIGKYDCICPPGKTGPVCQHDDECYLKPCHGSATCLTDPFGHYSCLCPRGWTGKNCTIDIDECTGSSFLSCYRGATCINTPGSFACQCASGFTGERCELSINECASNPCSINSLQCLDYVNEFKCLCKAGWTGILCDTEINEGVSVCPSREIQATEGDVTSPNFPSTYPADSDCTLVINGGDNVKFKLKFEFLEVEEDEDDPNMCNYDVLTIVDGSKTFRYCGSGIIPDYTSTGNKISITFQSDSSYELKGFKISFSTFSVQTTRPPGTSICPTREKKVRPDAPETMSGALFSPKSPNNYLNDVRCTVTLDVPDNYKTVIWFQKFSLQFSPTCEFDKLVLSDEIDSSTQCGGSSNQLPPPIELKGRKVQMNFTSDDKITAPGFQLKYNITRLQQGRCVCTSGLGYVTIDNYKKINSRKKDDIRFEFKSTQSSGMIMYARGRPFRDYVYVAYKDSTVFMYHIDLGTGDLQAQTTNLTLNDNKWHKVHLTRVDRDLTITIDDGLASFVGRTPGGFNRLDIPTSKAYILGAPSSQKLLPNFIGCIRDFEIDGHEPMTNAWVEKPDYVIMGRSSMRLCSASDEQ